MPFWEQLGLQAAGSAIGTGMGLMLEGHEDKRQLRQQQKLQDMQIAGQQQMGIFNREQQMQMWHDTNYKPQMDELKKAGLNPALMYGEGGGGGVTASSTPGNVSGGKAPEGTGTAGQMAGMGMQLALQKAQIENINADTANKVAQNPNFGITGENIHAGTENTQADTKNKALQGENIKADTLLKQADADIANAAAQVANSTIEENIQAIVAATATAEANTTQAEAQNMITQATKETTIRMIKTKALGMILDNALTKAVTAKTGQETMNIEAERRNIKNKIQMWAQDNYIDLQNMSTEQRRTAVQEQLKDQKLRLEGVDEITNVVSQALDGIFRGAKEHGIKYIIKDKNAIR